MRLQGSLWKCWKIVVLFQNRVSTKIWSWWKWPEVPKGETKLVSAGCIRQFSESHPTIFKSNPPNQPRTNKLSDAKQEVHDSSPHPTLPITFNQLPTSNEGSQWNNLILLLKKKKFWCPVFIKFASSDVLNGYSDKPLIQSGTTDSNLLKFKKKKRKEIKIAAFTTFATFI